MFTGIITDIGTGSQLSHRGDLHARIATGYDTSGIDIGASIACDGVCLTVTATGEDWFDVISRPRPCRRPRLATWAEGARSTWNAR
jgi:riboflavin synthase